MDRVFSARLDEAMVDELNRMTKRLGISKKQFLEEAIRLRLSRPSRGGARDLWAETCGAWRRSESPATTVRRTRRAFETSARRYQRPKGVS
jgi:hypothetical protein